MIATATKGTKLPFRPRHRRTTKLVRQEISPKVVRSIVSNSATTAITEAKDETPIALPDIRPTDTKVAVEAGRGRHDKTPETSGAITDLSGCRAKGTTTGQCSTACRRLPFRGSTEKRRARDILLGPITAPGAKLISAAPSTAIRRATATTRIHRWTSTYVRGEVHST